MSDITIEIVEKVVSVEPQEETISLLVEEKLVAIEAGHGGNVIDAIYIRGIPVSSARPSNRDTLIYDEESGEWAFDETNDALSLRGTPISSTPPEDNDLLIYNEGEWALSNIENIRDSLRRYEKSLLASDIANGYVKCAIKASGNAGEITGAQLIPVGGGLQRYGIDYTAMNDDLNENTYVIFKHSTTIPGIGEPVCPTVGLTSLLEEGDILQIFY